MALSQKSRNKFPHNFEKCYCENLGSSCTITLPLNQNGGHSTVLPRADGTRAGGLGKEEPFFQGKNISGHSTRIGAKDNRTLTMDLQPANLETDRNQSYCQEEE